MSLSRAQCRAARDRGLTLKWHWLPSCGGKSCRQSVVHHQPEVLAQWLMCYGAEQPKCACDREPAVGRVLPQVAH